MVTAESPQQRSALLVQRPDGTSELFQYGATGGSVSFAFGRKGFRSSVWSVAASAAGDVYVSERVVAHEIKTSLHASGYWQHGWVKDQRTGRLTRSGAAHRSATGSRVFDSHRRPAPDKAGITPGVSIVVTHNDVTPWPNDSIAAGGVRWSDAPAEGQAGVFAVLLTTPSTPLDLVGIQGVVGVLGMHNGEVVVVTSTLFILDNDELAVAAEMRASIRRLHTDEEVAGLRLASGESIRAQFIRPTPGGHREIWDLGLRV